MPTVIDEIGVVRESPEHSALQQTALRGTFWTFFAYGSSQSIRFLSNLILSRLLTPESFGVMAITNTLLLGLFLFSDVGLQYSVIQSKHGDNPRLLNTAWTVQAGRGLFLWITTILLAWPLASLYDQPRLVAILPVAGFGLAIEGLSSTRILTLGRDMGVGSLARLELISQAIQVATMLGWAWFSPGIWALVAGNLAGYVSRTLLSHVILPGLPNRFLWDSDVVRSLAAFGKWTLLSTGLMFLAEQSDRLILGKLISPRLLGVYGIAYALSEVPRQVIVSFSARVGLPFLAKFTHLPRSEFASIFTRYRMHVLLVAAVVLALIISTGDLLVVGLYDVRYHEAAWMVPVLALGLWHTLLYSTAGPALLAIGDLRYNSAGNLGRFLAVLAGVPLAYFLAGMRGAIIAIAFSDLPMYFAVVYGQFRKRITAFRQDAMATGFFLTLVLAGWLVRTLGGFGSPFASRP